MKKNIDDFHSLESKLEDLKVEMELLELGEGSPKEIQSKCQNLDYLIDGEETKTFMGGTYDQFAAIATIHAGAGGKDAADWAEMLFRMYGRWCKDSGYSTNIIDILAAEEGGLKSVTFSVEGNYAYGRLKHEVGIHRLVRISPFDSGGRRHTSFASFGLSPMVEDPEIEIDQKDLKIDTFKSGGPGGQHVNTTDSAVRITHIPTGTVVSCSNGRSQLKNREEAMKVLYSRLLELEIERKEEEMRRLKGENKEISWGNQIRSYVLHPYKMVKDHRTQHEVGDVQRVLDGDIDQFIDKSLRSKGV